MNHIGHFSGKPRTVETPIAAKEEEKKVLTGPFRTGLRRREIEVQVQLPRTTNAYFSSEKRIVHAVFGREIVFYKRIVDVDRILIGTLDPLMLMDVARKQ